MQLAASFAVNVNISWTAIDTVPRPDMNEEDVRVVETTILIYRDGLRRKRF